MLRSPGIMAGRVLLFRSPFLGGLCEKEGRHNDGDSQPFKIIHFKSEV